MKIGREVAAAVAMLACGGGALRAETKVRKNQTPPAVQKTIERELVGAELEDIAKKKGDGQTVYETDIVRDGEKWEVIIGEDGKILSKHRDGAAGTGGWRDHFDVDKASLLPTGDNPYLPMQPGRVLRLRNGSDTLTLTILADTQEVDGVRAGILEET